MDFSAMLNASECQILLVMLLFFCLLGIVPLWMQHLHICSKILFSKDALVWPESPTDNIQDAGVKDVLERGEVLLQLSYALYQFHL